MKCSLCVLLLLFVCRAVPAQTNEASIDVNGLMDAAQAWAQDNLDPAVVQALQGVDRTQVQDFLKHYQDYLKGNYVLDLAQLQTAAVTVLPLLEAHEETQPYAAWLRGRLDYFEAAAEMQALPVETNVSLPLVDTNAPGTNVVVTPPVGPNAVSPVRLANPSFKVEQAVWGRKVAPRPWPKAAAEVVPELKPIFTSEGVPAQLVWLAEVESGFDAEVESPAGALGMFQLMPATAKQYGLSLWPFDERKEPEPAARAAAKILHGLYGRFGDWRLAVAAYNCGAGRVEKTLAQYESKKGEKSYAGIATHLPAETQMYVPKVEATIALREGVNLEKLPAPGTL